MELVKKNEKGKKDRIKIKSYCMEDSPEGKRLKLETHQGGYSLKLKDYSQPDGRTQTLYSRGKLALDFMGMIFMCTNGLIYAFDGSRNLPLATSIIFGLGFVAVIAMLAIIARRDFQDMRFGYIQGNGCKLFFSSDEERAEVLPLVSKRQKPEKEAVETCITYAEI